MLEGEVSYPDDELPIALDDDSEGQCLPCTAIVRSNLTIEIEEFQINNEVPKEVIDISTIPCRVEKIEYLTSDVMRLLLKLPPNQNLKFLAGQYLKLFISDGTYRNFSIANAPHNANFIELHIKKFGGGSFMKWIFEEMAEKSILKIEAPFGELRLNEKSSKSLIFVGGGTGFAPLKSLIEHAIEMKINKEMFFFWGAKTEDDLYLNELPKKWSEEFSNFHYIPVLSSPSNSWLGKAGWVHDAVLSNIDDISKYDVYMAGPPAMLSAARESFLQKNMNKSQLHYDPFEFD